ncbi:MFS transporter [Actinophytocola sp.]|uniref:MFS transporter n=1 Tax=Actinophytocola sp. TaxID=1872138 RepID=UPI002D80F752|nr:MFS transporter [Actinophytocola sp.]HET9139955.1 MFS transporter [Actinophytocola sp.]
MATEIAGPDQKSGLRHNRDYWWFWFGQTISALGDDVFTVTLTLWIATVVVGDEPWAPLAVAGVLVAETVPIMLLSLVAGVYADRWNRRRIMLAADAVRCVLVAGLAVVVFIGPALPRGVVLAITWTVSALVSAAAQFFGPARFGMLGAVVDDADRERAASIATGSTALTGIIGPSLGAVLLVVAGAQWAMLLNAASFAVSFFAVAKMRTGRGPAPPAAAAHAPFWRELMEGFRYLAGNRMLKVLLITTTTVTAVTSCLAPLEVFFVTENLNGSPAVYGIIETAAGVGVLAGAAVTAIFVKPFRAASVYAYAIVASGVLLACYSRMTTPLGAIVIMFVAGFPLAAQSSMTGPLMLRATPAQLLGRVSTAFQPINEIASLVTLSLAAWLASSVLRDLDATVLGVHLGPIDTILLAAGVLTVLTGFAAAWAFRRA